MSWIPFPFLRYALFLSLGILSYPLLSPYLTFYPAFAVFLLAVVAYIVVVARTKPAQRERLRLPMGMASLFILWLLGFLVTYQRTASNHPDNLTRFPEIQAYLGRVDGEVYFKGKTWRTDLRIERVRTPEGWRPASGTVRLYIKKSQTGRKPMRYKASLLVREAPQRVRPPTNPHAFDYRKYLANKNIYHTHYLPPTHYHVLDSGQQSEWDPQVWGIRIRAYGRNLIETYLNENASRAIASALLLGIKDNIDDELRAAYAGAGAMHILAVSGLHVGIVFTLLSRLFKLAGRSERSRITVFTSLLVLWGYALVTGFSASVVRAVLMFSFINVGKLFRRHNITYNSIGTSAFLLLMYRPQFLYEVGFQLSYLAVLGIVFLYPRWSRLWEPKYWLVRRGWELVVVSVAAQLATAPLAVYYFHQFPNFFLLANLIVLPAVAVILNIGMAFLALGHFPLVGKWLGLVFERALNLMNATIRWIEGLPYAVSDSLFLTGSETFLIYLFILIALGFWFGRQRWLGGWGLAVILLGCILHTVRVEKIRNEEELVVYDLPVTALSFREGQHMHYWLDTSNYELDAGTRKYALQGYRLRAYADTTTLEVPHEKLPFGQLWVWQQKRILRLTKPVKQLPFHTVDVLILSNNAARTPEQLPDELTWKTLVLDKTNYRTTIRAFETDSLSSHNIRKQGAFLME